jgi:ribonuclease HI
MLDTVTVYTDGACDPNPGPGGWGVILLFGKHKKTLSGGANESTNNRMELTAVIEALTALKRRVHVRLHTDSTYVQRGVTEHLARWKANGWRTSTKKDVANRDLWEALDRTLSRHDVEWIWVKGHAGDPLNEEVDRLAVAATPRVEQTPAEADTIHIFTGASCLGNTGPGGWAAVIKNGDELAEISGNEPVCSANEMHLMAIERGLSLIEQGAVVHIHTPSDYAAQGGARWVKTWQAAGWRTREGGAVKNQDLWKAIVAQSQNLRVTWHNLKDIPRSPHSQRADSLAREAARRPV